MKKVIRLTESDLMRIVKRIINEQGIMFNVGNVFIADIISNTGSKSTNQHIKIEEINGDTITVKNLNNPADHIMVGVKDLNSDYSGNTYKRTDKKGSFRLIKKK